MENYGRVITECHQTDVIVVRGQIQRTNEFMDEVQQLVKVCPTNGSRRIQDKYNVGPTSADCKQKRHNRCHLYTDEGIICTCLSWSQE